VVLAVVTSSPPAVEGGHLVIARSLVAAARGAGHDAHLVVTPDYGFGRQAIGYWRTWRTDVRTIDGRPIDQVISLRYPSYAVRHPRHVCWLNHTMREYYDLWPRLTASISLPNRVKESARKAAIRRADRWLLTRNVTRVVAQSQTIRRRLEQDFGIHADVVYPPPPQRRYRCDDYGDHVFCVSRLTTHKRVDFLVRALADPVARRVKAVIAGEGEERPALEAMARTLGVAERVTFLGRIDDDTMLQQYARCRAVCFTPLAEDYGFVTVEAFASAKAVITCSDSGGPTELVKDDENGVVCDPTPPSIALALARLTDDRVLAERLGANARRRVNAMSWEDAVNGLLLAR
jgi:glycosyltransferase involved in cell wall biosynthesis